jgi:CIC family chloride channel protein
LNLRSVENVRMLLMALVVGLATAGFVYVFRLLISLLQWLVGEVGTGQIGSLLAAIGLPPQLAVVIVLALTGALVGWKMHTFVGKEQFSGVSSILVACWLSGGKLPYIKMPVKILASALSMGAGASVGRVDPSVQIGANIGSFFGQWLHLSEEHIRLLMAAGAASAIAAAFNAPIAGTFFAIEVILIGHLSLQSSGVVMLAAVMSTAFTQSLAGDVRVFEDLTYSLGSPAQLPLVVILGVLLAGVSWATLKVFFWKREWIAGRIKLSPPLLGALGGTVVGLIGVFLPAVLGPGEAFMRSVINGEAQLTVLMLLTLGVFKLIATGISRGTGFVGGVFSPILFMGITFGSAYGQALLRVPGLNSQIVGDPQSYAIVGMAGLLAGVVQAPITAIMLVFELTNDYRLILPIMLTSITCIFAVNYLRLESIYATVLTRRGINLELERDIDVMQGIDVREAMASPAYTISQDANLLELRDALRSQRVRALCVVDDRGKLVGMVTLGDLQRFFDSDREHPEEVAQHPIADIMTHDVITAHPDDKLWQAIQTMGASDVGRLPVIDRLTSDLVGVISRRAIIETYNSAIKRKIDDQHHAEQVRLSALTGASVTEFRVTEQMAVAGHRIRDLVVAEHFVIASVQRGTKLIVPRGFTQIRAGDVLTIVAEPDVLEMMEDLFIKGPIATIPLTTQELRVIVNEG